MNLTFFNRTPLRAIPSPSITIAHDGPITLNDGVVEALQLRRLAPVHLVRDEDTKRWYLCFGEVAGQKPAVLGNKNKQSAGLTFSHRPAARSLYAQFQISAEHKSLSLPVGTTPTAGPDQLQLYPIDTSVLGLAPLPVLPANVQELFAEPPVMAAVVETLPAPEADTMSAGADIVSVPVVEPVPEPVAEATPAAPKASRPDAYTDEQRARILAEGGTKEGRQQLADEWGRKPGAIYAAWYNLQGKQKAVAPEPVKPYVPIAQRQAAPATPALGDTLLGQDADRAEQLASYWFERELSNASDRELAEVGQVLSAVLESERDFQMNLVLERAKKETKRRRLQAAA